MSHLLENLVSLVPNSPRDVISLCRPAGGVNEDDRVVTEVGGVQGASEELVVGTVDGVSALEGDDILPCREHGPDLLGGTADEVTDGQVEAGDLSSHIVLAALGGDHEGARMLR